VGEVKETVSKTVTTGDPPASQSQLAGCLRVGG